MGKLRILACFWEDRYKPKEEMLLAFNNLPSSFMLVPGSQYTTFMTGSQYVSLS